MKASHLLNEIGDDKGVWFIEGDKESGKTTLLKKMYRDFHEKEWVPVFLDGEKISDIPV
ncbi:hypothetical protein [Enterococcus faecalis]|nr:hypothetical protein [Enterococcus faecalis]